jgi:hypothetical protein
MDVGFGLSRTPFGHGSRLPSRSGPGAVLTPAVRFIGRSTGVGNPPAIGRREAPGAQVRAGVAIT